jgi:hypothetical protein
MIVLTYTFTEPIITQPILNLHSPIGAKYTLCFTYLIKKKKINKKHGKKGKPFQRKHEHECMEEHKLDKRTNLVNDKKKFLLTTATSFDTQNRSSWVDKNFSSKFKSLE